MKIAEDTVVTMTYKLTDTEGTVLEQSDPDEDFAYIHGHGQLPDRLEEELEGKESGARVQITVTPEDGFGEREENQIITVPRDDFPNDEELIEGLQVEAETQDGHQIFSIVKFDEETVTLDGNHPYAGMTLSFDVTVKEIREASESEVEHGHAHNGDHHHH